MRHPTVSPRIQLHEVDEVPSDSQVSHYDELSPEAQDRLFDLVQCDKPSVSNEKVDELQCYEIVKFTDYYEISID